MSACQNPSRRLRLKLLHSKDLRVFHLFVCYTERINLHEPGRYCKTRACRLQSGLSGVEATWSRRLTAQVPEGRPTAGGSERRKGSFCAIRPLKCVRFVRIVRGRTRGQTVCLSGDTPNVNVPAILVLSVVLPFGAAGIALWLVRITQRKVYVAAHFRRHNPHGGTAGDHPVSRIGPKGSDVELSAEPGALGISVLTIIALAFVVPLFRGIQASAEALRESERRHRHLTEIAERLEIFVELVNAAQGTTIPDDRRPIDLDSWRWGVRSIYRT